MNLTFNVSQCKDNTTNDVGYTTVEIAIRSAVVLLVSVTIILSNLLNFVILWTIKNISPVTKVFLINLTTADFCTGLIGCLPAIAPAINGTWPYGAIWCQISAIVHGSCSTVSIWSVGVIGVERYIATSYPVFYKNKMTQKRSLGIVCLLWTSCLILFVAPTIIKGEDQLHFRFNPDITTCVVVCESKWVCIGTGFMVGVLSGLVIIFTTTSVTKSLRQRMTANTGTGIAASTQNTLRQRSWSYREKKVIRLLVATISLYFMTWGPFFVVFFLGQFELFCQFSGWLLFTSMWMANSNCFVNVIIYSAIYPSFRFRLKTILYVIFCCGGIRSRSRVEPWTG